MIGNSTRRRFILGLLSMMVATPLLASSPSAAPSDGFEILKRWHTDNTTLRPFTYDDGVLYVAGDVTIEAWNTADGSRLWRQSLDSPADFRPRLAGNLVLAIGRTFLTAYDRKTGDKRWSYRPAPTPNAPFEPIATPYYHDGHIYLGVGPMMTALDLNGKIVWQRSTQKKKGIWYAPTTADKQTILFGPGDGLLYALDSQTGEIRWSLDNSKKWQYLRQLHMSGTTVVAGGYKDNLFGVDTQSGEVAWHWYSGNFINSHLVHNGMAYLWSPTGWVYALDAETGSINWRTLSDYFPKKNRAKRPWGPVMAELVADGTNLFVLDMQNTLHILDTQTGEERKALEFPDLLSPFIALGPGGEHLFLGTTEGEVLHIAIP